MAESRISRRTVLRGLGTAVALPMLEAMLPLSAVAQSLPKAAPNRLAFLFVPNGVNMEHWTPAEVGKNYALSSTLQPLEPLRKKFSVLTGLAQHNAHALGDGPGDHARSTAVWLTGVHPKKTAGSDIRNGISADQVAAQRLGKLTKFASLEIGCERGAQAGDCDSGYSCAYSSSISWRSETTPMAKEVNPRLVFERLFGSADGDAEARAQRDRYRKSILDFVSDDAQALRAKLGLRDKQKLDEYLTGVREIEDRLQRLEKEHPEQFLDPKLRPKGVPADYGEHIRLLGDMMVLAFQADLTRICTFMFANDGSNRNFRSIGISDGHHDVSHHGKDPAKLEKKRQIDRYYIEQLGYILNRMDSIKELDGTLLDNTMLVYGAGISDGDRHNHDDLPILLCGGGGGKLKPGSHMKFQSHTPMNNLFLSLLDRMGVPIETLGDSTGKLKELF
jgi:hypothetical protein